MESNDANLPAVNERAVPLPASGEKKRRARRGRSSPATIERAEREREAIVLRRAGLSYDEVAQRLGFRDRSGAKKAVERGLSRWMRDADEELRAIMLDRAERVVARLWPSIDCDDPDLKAIDAFLRVTDLEARLSGAYAPRRQQLDVAVHARVEHSKLQALRLLQDDPDIIDVINEDRNQPNNEVSHD